MSLKEIYFQNPLSGKAEETFSVLRLPSFCFYDRCKIHCLFQENVTDSFRGKKNVILSATRICNHLVAALHPLLYKNDEL
jgi:hypothetical protein